jgi:hypothetical protein
VAAKILLKLGTTQKLVVPEAALIRRGELTAVKVLANGRSQLRQVRVGPSTGTGVVEVLAGLIAGEQVAIGRSADER